MVALFYFEDKVYMKKLQGPRNILFFPRVLGTILEFYGFLAEPRKEKKHHYGEVYTISNGKGV